MVEIRVELEVLSLRDRIKLVIVTASAADGHPHPDGGGGLGTIKDILHPVFLGDPATLAVERMIAVKPTGHQLVEARVLQQVTSQLVDGELVKGHVVIECLDHPVPPERHRPCAISLVAVGITVTGCIEPVPGHVFTEAG